MFGNPYYNQQTYQQDLQNIIVNAQNKLNQLNNQTMQQPQTQTPITQNFQIAPTQKNGGLNFASNIEEVKKELVFGDTLFLNNDYTLLWLKNASGLIKSYQLIEIPQLDEKDLKINALMAELEELKKERLEYESTRNDVSNVNESVKDSKSSNVSDNKPSKK